MCSILCPRSRPTTAVVPLLSGLFSSRFSARALVLALVLPLPVALGCGERQPDPAVSTAAASAQAAVRIPFELYGHPGPWWRDDASQAEFDQDIWQCRTESKRARADAPSEARKDVAYRAFVDCMAAQAWHRGQPPREEAAG